MWLTRAERWMLYNQFLILAKLYPEDAASYQEMREIVEQGYELNYKDICGHIVGDDDVISTDECMEVLDILDMFRGLNYTYEALGDKAGIDHALIQFGGFDGNEESKYLSYTHFLVVRQNKYAEQARGDFNSQFPMLEHYRRMVAEWKASSDKYHLTKEDVIRISSV